MKAYIHLIKWLAEQNITVTVSQSGIILAKERNAESVRQLLMESAESLLVFEKDGETNAASIVTGVRPEHSVEVVTGDTLLQWKYQYSLTETEIAV